MTVIVATRDAMYSDSMCSVGDTSYPCEKIFRFRDELVGTAGNVRSIEKFMRWYKGGRSKMLELEADDQFAIMVLNKRGIFVYIDCSMEDRVTRDFHSVGSGSREALAAMFAGADPKRAIEIACKVNNWCDTPVQAFSLDPKRNA